MIALRSPEETLVLVPHIVGYRPARQLVLCGLDQRVVDASGRRACMGPVVVVDCAAESVGEDHARFIAEVVGHHRVTKAVIVLYCDDLAQVEGTAAARLEHVHAMALQALAPAPDGFLASYAVDGTSFVRVDGSEATVRSLRELDSCQAAAELVYKGSSPLREPPSPEIEAKPEAERDAARGESARAERAERTPQAIAAQLAAVDALLACPDAGRPADRMAHARMCGRVSAALCNPDVRDRVLLYGIDPAVETPLAGVGEEELFSRLAAAAGRALHIDRIRRVIALLEEVASYRVRGEHAALAAAGYLHWWSCTNSLAAKRVRQAARIDPGYPLAHLLLDVVSSGTMAPWYSALTAGSLGVGDSRPRRRPARSRPAHSGLPLGHGDRAGCSGAGCAWSPRSRPRGPGSPSQWSGLAGRPPSGCRASTASDRRTTLFGGGTPLRESELAP